MKTVTQGDVFGGNELIKTINGRAASLAILCFWSTKKMGAFLKFASGNFC